MVESPMTYVRLNSFYLFTGFAVLRGSLYAVGGFDGLTVLKTVERWDQTADRWNYVAPLRIARSGMGVAFSTTSELSFLHCHSRSSSLFEKR